MEEEKAHIRAKAIIEVLGKPKEHVEKAMADYIENIKKDTDLAVVKEEYSEPKEKDNFWLMFVDMEIVFKGLPKLVRFCFEYMPSSIEILKPEALAVHNHEISGFLNDLQARLHNVDMAVKQLKNENIFLKRNMKTLLENSIKTLLSLGSLDIEKISRLTGVQKAELESFLDKIVEENKLKKEGSNYSLVEDVQSQEQG